MSFSDLMELEAEENPSSGGGGEKKSYYFKPDGKTKGEHVLRLYRFDRGGKQILCDHHRIHWVAGRKHECAGAGCEHCANAKSLQAVGDEASKERAWDQRMQSEFVFMVKAISSVNPKDVFGKFPIRMEANFFRAKQILFQIARSGGFGGAAAPERGEDSTQFDECVTKGKDVVCGPAGKDLVIHINPGKGRDTFACSINALAEAATLDVEEDAEVKDPRAMRLEYWRST